MAAVRQRASVRLGRGRPGDVQRQQRRGELLRRPRARGLAVRRVQPGLRDLRVRAQRLARPGHRPAAGQVQQHGPTDVAAGRRECTGTAVTVGLVAGAFVLAAAVLLSGTARLAFLALGLTLPGLMLQDSWRYAFFALGRGGQAFLNDTVWTLTLLPALVLLRVTHHGNVFWFVLAWGAAAAVAAAVGPLQARVVPRLSGAWEWVRSHRDLGPATWRRTPPTALRPAAQLRRRHHRGPGRGRLRAGRHPLMGPFMVIFLGMSLVTVPEAARVLRRSPRHLELYCLLVGAGLAASALAWGVVLLVALPERPRASAAR